MHNTNYRWPQKHSRKFNILSKWKIEKKLQTTEKKVDEQIIRVQNDNWKWILSIYQSFF
jgi:transposase-like protein